MATAQLNRARTVKKLEKPRPLKLNQRNSTVDGRITTGKSFIFASAAKLAVSRDDSLL